MLLVKMNPGHWAAYSLDRLPRRHGGRGQHPGIVSQRLKFVVNASFDPRADNERGGMSFDDGDGGRMKGRNLKGLMRREVKATGFHIHG